MTDPARTPHPTGPVPDGPVPDDPDVLELRVHGVNNTPPHRLLDLEEDDVERVAGDALGSFWRPTDATLGRLPADHPARPPAGVLREAYSWGGLARSSPTLPGAAGPVAGAVGRVAWVLLLPFGLVNTAFWTRELHRGESAGRWQSGRQAAVVRTVALAFTLLLVGTVCVVALDVLATQCFRDGRTVCPALPTWAQGPADDGVTARLAGFALLPIGVLVLVVAVAALSRTRYEQLTAGPGLPEPELRARWDGGDPPLLGAPAFWVNARLTAAQSRLHLAAGLAFVVLSSAWYAAVREGAACGTRRDLACLVSFTVAPGTPWVLVLTSLVAAVTLVGAVVLLAVGAGWADLGHRAGPPSAPEGTDDGPVLERRATRLAVVAVGTLVLHLVVLAASPGPDDDGAGAHRAAPEASLLLVVGYVLVAALLARGWRRPPAEEAADDAWRRRLMWDGRAPSVLLLLALAFALLLSTWVVVGAGDWLNGPGSAGDLLPTSDPSASELVVPAFYVWSGATTLVALLVLGGTLWAAWRRTGTIPPAPGSPEDRPVVDPPWGSPAEVAARPGADEARASARRFAALAHRAEPALGRTATVLGWCAVAAVVLTVAGWARPGAWPATGTGWGPTWLARVWDGLVDASAWVSGGAALVVVLALVGGGLTGGVRPLGLLWDLICFLPRTGHPLGPPCYAERAVPELVRRWDDWLRGGPHRRVVVSAHSLGAVLVVAALLTCRTERGRAHLDRVGLLTYGVQLRPYFGRLFPELLGPTVLGTTPARGADLTTPDPWQRLVAEDAVAPPPPDGPLRELLDGPRGTRWLSLWRRTDYLGFPVDRYPDPDGASPWPTPDGVLDRPAEEIDTAGYLPTVASHSGYARAGAYRVAFDDLLDRLRDLA